MGGGFLTGVSCPYSQETTTNNIVYTAKNELSGKAKTKGCYSFNIEKTFNPVQRARLYESWSTFVELTGHPWAVQRREEVQSGDELPDSGNFAEVQSDEQLRKRRLKSKQDTLSTKTREKRKKQKKTLFLDEESEDEEQEQVEQPQIIDQEELNKAQIEEEVLFSY